MPLVHYLHLLGLPQFPKPFLHCTWTPSSWAEWNQTLALAAQRRGKQLPPLQNAVKPPATPARRREEPWGTGPEERCARTHGHGPRCRELQLEGKTRVTTRHFERPSAFPWDADLRPAWTQGRPQAQKILQIFNKQKRSLHKTLPPQRQSHSQRRWSRGARTASSCSDPPEAARYRRLTGKWAQSQVSKERNRNFNSIDFDEQSALPLLFELLTFYIFNT